MEILTKLLNFLTPYGTYSYVGIFLVLLACGFGFPMPEDIILIVGGILSSQGVIDFWMTVTISMAGVLIGDGIIFFLGKKFGTKIRNFRFFRWILPPERDARVQQALQKYGDKVIFMGRFMPGLRVTVFFASGAYKISSWKFIIFDGVAALISVPAWVYVGHLFGSNLEELERIIGQFRFGIHLTLGAVLLALIVLVIVKKRIRAT